MLLSPHSFLSVANASRSFTGMTQRILLHIGRHKCGTTSIQKALLQQRETLARAGFIYPETVGKEPGHHALARGIKALSGDQPAHILYRMHYWLIAGAEQLSWWQRKRVALGRLPSLIEHLRNGELPTDTGNTLRDRAALGSEQIKEYVEELRRSKADTAIISSEALQNCAPEAARKVLSDFDVQVVCYLRDQADYLRSAYTQRVQATDYHQSIEEYYRLIFRADYYQMLSAWDAVFPNAITVRVFQRDQLVGGDAVSDFFTQCLGQQPCSVEKSRENPSLSATLLAFKLRLNQEGYQQQHRLYGVLPNLEHADFPRFQLSAALHEKVRGDYAVSNSQVARRWLGAEQLFDSSTERNPNSNSDLAIDDSTFAALLEQANRIEPGCITPPSGS